MTPGCGTLIAVVMSSATDKDIAIWVCPSGYTHDVLEFPIGSAEPDAKVCGTHGEPFHKRCPNPDCPSPTYHPSDLEQIFHKPCGLKIPWAETRREYAQIDYEPFNSTLIGRTFRKPATKAEEFIRERYFPSTEPVRELTPGERHDLIVPPSGRLPNEWVRPKRTKNEPPRITAHRGTGSHLSEPDLIPATQFEPRRDMSRFIDAASTRESTNQETRHGVTHVARQGGPVWRRVLRGLWDLFFGSLQNAIGGLILILILIALAVYFGIRLTTAQ